MPTETRSILRLTTFIGSKTDGHMFNAGSMFSAATARLSTGTASPMGMRPGNVELSERKTRGFLSSSGPCNIGSTDYFHRQVRLRRLFQSPAAIGCPDFQWLVVADIAP